MLQKSQASHGHVQVGGWGERKERGGRVVHERLAPDAALSKIHLFEAEPETGCGFPFKGLVPQIGVNYQK